jgi:hypothetical protein
MLQLPGLRMTKGHGIDADGSLRAGARALGCNTSYPWQAVVLECHRAPDHAGSHLDTEHDVWFSRNSKGIMVCFPRREADTVPSSARRRVTTTRRGM